MTFSKLSKSHVRFNQTSSSIHHLLHFQTSILYIYKLWPITTEQSGELEISLQFRMPKVLPTQEHHSGIVGRFSSCKCNTWNKPGPTKNWAKPFHPNATCGTKTCPWRKFNGHSSCNISSNGAMLSWKGNKRHPQSELHTKLVVPSVLIPPATTSRMS